MCTPWEAKNRSHSTTTRLVADDRRSRSTCSDQSAVPNEVQTVSCSPVSATVIVEKGASGLRRKMRATSPSTG